MQTITIEILRLGTPYNYNLSGDHKYLALCGSQPSVEFSVACDQLTFNKQIRLLRYDNPDPGARQKGMLFFQEIIVQMFAVLKPLSPENAQAEDWLYFRLIITPKELAQLLFELILTPKELRGQPGTPLLMNPDQLTTLTREVRQMTPSRYIWPSRPRILYAWAMPTARVPQEEHYAALREILKPLAAPIPDNEEPIPNLGEWITILKKASLNAITQEIKAGLAYNKPYTHIHLLAHGSKVRDEESGSEAFKMVLHDDNDPNKAYYAAGGELAAAMTTENKVSASPAVVSLMTCDSGHGGSMIAPAGSIAHELHEAGIPCVFASQFPLSIPGSVKLVACLYKNLLLDREDPRKALYHARVAINDPEFHDWASLMAYIRLPDNIDWQLEDAKLKAMFAAMYTSNLWTDHVIKFKDQIEPTRIGQIFTDVLHRLDNSIANLLNCLTGGYSVLATPELKAEHLGLLGSGYKRKSEHLFRMAELNPLQRAELLNLAKMALAQAKDFYFKGFDALPASHWNALQYLSLKAVLDGTLATATAGEIWTVVKFMAEKVEQSDQPEIDKAWSWGTLAELYLLKPLTESFTLIDKTNALERAKEYISKIKESKKASVLESTQRQFARYIYWWPAMYPDTYRKELQEMAIEIRHAF